jgi:methylated-DNA-protein-cysteine methyltransferase-like protein
MPKTTRSIDDLSTFQRAVIQAIRQVPAGKVVSYGQIAAAIGAPRAARQVGWALSQIGEAPDFPWWRVINAKGCITINNPHFGKQQQRQLLEAESVTVDDDYSIAMQVYRYDLAIGAPWQTSTERQSVSRLADKFFDGSQ